jgi:hypothetical protein
VLHIPSLDVSITPPCPPLTKGRIVPGVLSFSRKYPSLAKRGRGRFYDK